MDKQSIAVVLSMIMSSRGDDGKLTREQSLYIIKRTIGNPRPLTPAVYNHILFVLEEFVIWLDASARGHVATHWMYDEILGVYRPDTSRYSI